MKKITILLSSVLTLLLITSNNASYAAPHITDFGFQGKKPNMNAFKGQVRKGNVFKGNVRILQGDSSGGIFNPISKYSISDEPSFFPKPNRGKFNPISKYSISDEPSFFPKPNRGKFNPISKYSISDEPSFFPKPNRGKFNPISKYSISDEPSFIPKPDAVGQAGFIGENRKVGLSVGPIGKDGFTKDIYYFTDGSSNTVSPKGVPLKFIEGEWVEPLAK